MLIENSPELKERSTFFSIVKRKILGFIFYIVYAFVFGLSGLITIIFMYLNLVPYRMAIISFLVLPLFLLYKIKNNRILWVYFLLTLEIILSGIINHSSFSQVLLFMRVLGFSFLIYYLSLLFINAENIKHLIRLSVLLAVVQLPIVLLQKMNYKLLPGVIKSSIAAVDFDFGTFNFKGDASMAMFILFIVIFLLFDRKRNYIIKHRWIVLPWLTLTVFVANADIVKILVVCVWGFYFLSNLKRKIIIYLIIATIMVGIVLVSTGLANKVTEKLINNILINISSDQTKAESFLSGNYGRGAALAYYLNKDISLIGDGPSAYYDPITRKRILGNTGHIFTFYSEIGLVGWFLSVMIFFLIAFPIQKSRIIIRWMSILLFISIQILSFTTEVMNDISIVLIYCIMVRSYLIPDWPDVSCRNPKEESSLVA